MFNWLKNKFCKRKMPAQEMVAYDSQESATLPAADIPVTETPAETPAATCSGNVGGCSAKTAPAKPKKKVVKKPKKKATIKVKAKK